MKKKICPKCNLEKDLEYSFYRSKTSKDSYRTFCKSCYIQQVKDNPKYGTFINRRQKAVRDNDLKLLKYLRETDRIYKQRVRATRPEIRESLNREKIKYEKRFPEKRKAHWTVSNHIRLGNLKKRPCEVCGNKKVHAHHSDYSKPLDVKWLCSVHHYEEHRQINVLKTNILPA